MFPLLRLCFPNIYLLCGPSHMNVCKSHLSGTFSSSQWAVQKAASVLGQSLDQLQSADVLSVAYTSPRALLQCRRDRKHKLQATVPRHGAAAHTSSSLSLNH